jgi:hypothetical protein
MPMALEVNKTNSIQLESIFSRLCAFRVKYAHVRGVLRTLRRILQVLSGGTSRAFLLCMRCARATQATVHC